MVVNMCEEKEIFYELQNYAYTFMFDKLPTRGDSTALGGSGRFFLSSSPMIAVQFPAKKNDRDG